LTEAVACPDEVIVDAVVFLEHFKDLPDERQSAKVRYPLAEVLRLCLLAVIAGAETITDIARFGDNKLDLLRRFRPFREGTPSHDHRGDILATLDCTSLDLIQRSMSDYVIHSTADIIGEVDSMLSRMHSTGCAGASIQARPVYRTC
jgi:DDE_Tnp_1-associated